MGITVDEQLWSGGDAVWCKLTTSIAFHADDRSESTNILGDLTLALAGIGDGLTSTLEAQRFRVVSPGSSLRNKTGKLAVDGEFGGGRLKRGLERHWRLEYEIGARVLYRAIQEKYTEQISSDIWASPQEPFEGYVTGELVEVEDEEDLNRLVFVSGSMFLRRVGEVLGLIDELEIPLDGTFMALSSVFTKKTCPGGLLLDKQQLRLRPLGFGDSPNDSEAAGSTWPTKLEKCRIIWSGCCLDLIPEPKRIIPIQGMKDSMDTAKIRKEGAEFADQYFGDGVEILMVRSALADGGGLTFDPTTGLATVVITDQGNPYLLAHELGHAMGGLHPYEKASGKLWEGSVGTILQESGGLAFENPKRRPLEYCEYIWKAGLPARLGTKGCASPYP